MLQQCSGGRHMLGERTAGHLARRRARGDRSRRRLRCRRLRVHRRWTRRRRQRRLRLCRRRRGWTVTGRRRGNRRCGVRCIRRRAVAANRTGDRRARTCDDTGHDQCDDGSLPSSAREHRLATALRPTIARLGVFRPLAAHRTPLLCHFGRLRRQTGVNQGNGSAKRVNCCQDSASRAPSTRAAA